MTALRAALALALAALVAVAAAADPLLEASRLRVGVGDRIVRWDAGKPQPILDEARSRGLPVDYLQLWLTRGWKDSWLEPKQLARVAKRGVVPVVVHYWFADHISRERIEDQRDAWYGSLWRMAQRIRSEHPVLVVLEPEFNIDPPPGETATIEWDGFAEEIRAAAELVRREAPNARVGVCAGDFPGPPRLERALGPVADDLDFLSFQEMRAVTDPAARRAGYRQVGREAVAFARYLQRAFGRPLLLGYVAVSTHGGWEQQQAAALTDLLRRADALREAGVFGAIYMQLFDDPEHEGYFGPAEKSFGLLRADGTPKPAFNVLRALARRGHALAARPEGRSRH